MQIKQQIRYFKRNKLFSIVNLIGLSISFSLIFLLLVFIRTENNVDGFHKKNIFRLVKANECAFSPPFGQYIVDNIEGVESFCRVFVLDATLKSGENMLRTKNCYYTDINFLDLFSVQLINRGFNEILNTKNSVILSESFAKKLFPKSNPIGKFIKFNNRLDYQITGIFNDFKQNSHFTQADVIFPFEALGDYFDNDKYLKQYDWHFFLPALYVTAKHGYDLSGEGKKLYDKSKSWYWLFQEEESCNVKFQPIKEAYFSPVSYGYVNGVRTGNPKLIDLFTLIVIGILIIAIINYINLTVSYTLKRKSEFEIKKLLGASKRNQIIQSLIETALFFIAALLISSLLIISALPAYNHLTGYQISILEALSVFHSFQLIGIMILIFSIAAIIPALIVSSYTPLSIVQKKTSKIGVRDFQKAMVVAQYTISIILIISMIVIEKQNRFLINYDLGFNKEETFYIQMNSEIKNKKIAFKEELQKIPGVKSVALCNGMPGVGIMNIRFESNNKTSNIDILNIDEDYFYTMGINLQKNSLFNEKTCWINQSAAKALNNSKDKGNIEIYMNGELQSYMVNEVLPDMNFHSLYQKSQPTIFTKLNTDDWVDYTLVRINTSNVQNVLSKVKKTYKTFCSNFPFDYSFLDETINRAYLKETQTAKIVSWFSIFAILISSLGIFALAVFTGNIRTKEIGIRKINGAKTFEIVKLLNKDFVKWVFIAFVIATPIAYYFMHKWLENFAYKTNLSWWIFIFAGVLGLGIAIITVSWQSWKTAIRNPVEALRDE